MAPTAKKCKNPCRAAIVAHTWCNADDTAGCIHGCSIFKPYIATDDFKMKTDNSVAYPLYYEENGGFNLSLMKHWMRKNNPELFDHIEQWFKADKKRKKRGA